MNSTQQLTKMKKTISGLRASLNKEKTRLDWLEKQVVEVRTPLRYGSRANFIAAPEDHDIGEWPSNLRDQIDKNL